MEDSNLKLFEKERPVLAKMLAVASRTKHTELEFKVFQGDVTDELFVACKRSLDRREFRAAHAKPRVFATLSMPNGIRVELSDADFKAMAKTGQLPSEEVAGLQKVSYLKHLRLEFGNADAADGLEVDTLELQETSLKATLRFELPKPLKLSAVPEGTHVRLIQRSSFYRDGMPVRYDLSKVRSGTLNGKDDLRDQLLRIIRSDAVNEVEAEFVKPDDSSPQIDDLLRALLPALQAQQASDYLLSKTDLARIRDEFERKRIVFVNPMTLTVETAPELLEGYSVTEKSDGVRAMLMVDSQRRVVSIQRSMRGTPIAFTGVRVKDAKLVGTVVDTEYMRDIAAFKLFDCLYWCGKDVRALPHLLEDAEPRDFRVGLCQLFAAADFERNVMYATPSIEAKRFLLANGDAMWTACATVLDEATGPIDGLIFTPAQDGYALKDMSGVSTWTKLLKYKQVHTIDFQVNFEGPVEVHNGELQQPVHLLVGKMGMDVIHALKQLTGEYVPPRTEKGRGVFAPALFEPEAPPKDEAWKAWLPIVNDKPRTAEGQVIEHKAVVEMSYDLETGTWSPLRLRPEKTMGNHIDAANQIWTAINNPITEDMIRNGWDVETRASSAAYYNDLRIGQRALDYSFHRKIKANLYKMWTKSGQSLLEVGCGRGGDMNNWHVETVVGLDVDLKGLDNGSADSASLRMLRAKQARRPVPKHVLFVHADAGRPLVDAALSDDSRRYMSILLGETAAETEPLRAVHGLFKRGVDVVSIQFAVHYFMKEQGILDVFLENLAAVTKPGSVVIGTCMDGGMIYGELLVNDTLRVANPTQPGLSAVEIKRLYEPSEKPWSDDALSIGLPISVWVETFGAPHTEYLVPFGHLTSVMQKAGFDLVESSMFKDLFPELQTTMTADQKRWSLLHRTFAFRRRAAATEPAKPKTVRISRKAKLEALASPI